MGKRVREARIKRAKLMTPLDWVTTIVWVLLVWAGLLVFLSVLVFGALNAHAVWTSVNTPLIAFPEEDCDNVCMMSWVYENIDYTPNVSSWNAFSLDYVAPQETLERGYGICIERAQLVCAFLRYHDYECYYKEFFILRNDFNIAGHVYPCTIADGEEYCVDYGLS